MFLLRLDDGFNGLFDPQVDHLIAVVGEDDVNQVLANVMHVTFDRGNQELGLG